MEAKIDKKGKLMIKRGGQFKHVQCRQGMSPNVTCSDWCSLFGEPAHEKVQDYSKSGYPRFTDVIQLELCHKTLVLLPDNFQDLRTERTDATT